MSDKTDDRRGNNNGNNNVFKRAITKPRGFLKQASSARFRKQTANDGADNANDANDAITTRPSIPAALVSSLPRFTKSQQKLIKDLCTRPELNQAHLFERFGELDEDASTALVLQLQNLDQSYPQGGLAGYIRNAKTLLENSKNGVNPLQGFSPSIPTGQSFSFGSTSDDSQHTNEYTRIEAEGIPFLGKVGFVLVAGGLGERLGYGDIKIGLPTELATETCYLQYYIEYILALQTKFATKDFKMPLCIMTSGDTNAGTVKLLQENSYFGMSPNQITIVQQGAGVPALLNNDAKIAMNEDKTTVSTKPHGHGDIHALLYREKVVAKWVGAGVEFISFFQDTNGLAFHTLPLAIGVSLRYDLIMNSLAVPRKEKQAIGAITKLTNETKRITRTVNVEYNQLDPLLRANGYENGDSNDPETGFSPFPGNINQLLFRAKPYLKAINSTKGVMPEFVNPKYKDAEKTEFKKPTRLECMMQDFPTVLEGKDAAKVGFTSIDSSMCFSPVKNATSDGVQLQKKGSPAGVAFTGEADQYGAVRKILQSIGVMVEDGKPETFLNITAVCSPEIVIQPSIVAFPGEYQKLFPSPENVKISKTSSLVIRGTGSLTIESLELDGALVINVEEGAKDAVISNLVVRNRGWSRVGVQASKREVIAMRGYELKKHETKFILFKSDGTNEGLDPSPLDLTRSSSSVDDCSACVIL